MRCGTIRPPVPIWERPSFAQRWFDGHPVRNPKLMFCGRTDRTIAGAAVVGPEVCERTPLESPYQEGWGWEE